MMLTLIEKATQRMMPELKAIKAPIAAFARCPVFHSIAHNMSEKPTTVVMIQLPTHSPLAISFAWSRAKVTSTHCAEFEGATV